MPLCLKKRKSCPLKHPSRNSRTTTNQTRDLLTQCPTKAMIRNKELPAWAHEKRKPGESKIKTIENKTW